MLRKAFLAEGGGRESVPLSSWVFFWQVLFFATHVQCKITINNTAFFPPHIFVRSQVTVGADDLTANYRVEQHVEVVEERERDGKLLRLLAQCHKTRLGREKLAALKWRGDEHSTPLPFTYCCQYFYTL